MSDLVRGKFHVTSPFWSYLGQPANAVQGNIAVRSNAEVLGVNALTDGAALTSGVITAVPVPVEIGDQISKVTVFVGATAAGTPTASFAALYAGTGAAPALISQTVNGGSAAIPASAAFVFTFASPVLITSTNAPFGFIYVAVSVTATTAPTLASATVSTAVGYKWFTNGPVALAAVSSGSAVGGVATTTLATPAAQAATPIVALS